MNLDGPRQLFEALILAEMQSQPPSSADAADDITILRRDMEDEREKIRAAAASREAPTNASPADADLTIPDFLRREVGASS
jgi:hypothetical protein